MNTDAKIFNKIIANRANSTIKGSYTMIKWFCPRDAKILQYIQINVIHHISTNSKIKNHMIISDAEKGFEKIQHQLMIKNSLESRHRRNNI